MCAATPVTDRDLLRIFDFTLHLCEKGKVRRAVVFTTLHFLPRDTRTNTERRVARLARLIDGRLNELDIKEQLAPLDATLFIDTIDDLQTYITQSLPQNSPSQHFVKKLERLRDFRGSGSELAALPTR